MRKAIIAITLFFAVFTITRAQTEAERIAGQALRHEYLRDELLSPEEKRRILERYLRGYRPIPDGYEGVVQAVSPRSVEQSRRLRKKAIESALKGEGLREAAGSAVHKPVGLKETPSLAETRLKEIPLKFYVPILKPSNCRSNIGYTDVSPPRRGYYATCPPSELASCLKAATEYGINVYETQIPGRIVYLMGPFNRRWKALDFVRKANVKYLDEDNIVFRRTLNNMRLYRPASTALCDKEVEDLVKEFASKVKTAKGRYEALGLYPLVVSKLEKANVSQEAVFTFYDAARRLFFDLGYLDLAWDAALAKVKIAGKLAGLADYELLVAIAKATNNPSYEYAAYLKAARGLKSKRPDKALLYYSDALSIRASRDLLLEIADFLESLGEHEEAAVFRRRAFRKWY